MTATASSLSLSEASDLNSMMAARASVKACLAALLVSFASAPRSTGSAVSSWRLEHRLRGGDPLGGIGRQQRQAAERGLHGAAQAVVEADGGGTVRQLVDGAPVAASMILPSACVMKTFLLSGSADSRPSCSALMIGEGERIARRRDRADRFLGVGEFVIGEFGDRVLERAGKAGRAKPTIRKTERMKRAKTIKTNGRHCDDPGRSVRRRRRIAAFSFRGSWKLIVDQRIRSPDRRTCWSWCCSCRTSCRPSRRSGPWSLRAPSTRRRRPPDPGSSRPRRTGRWP